MTLTLLYLAGAFAAAMFAAWYLTGRLREYSIARAILDVPNTRSSHSTPTPRGGGLAIVGLIVAAVLLLLGLGLIDYRATAAFLGVVPIALIGWHDDVKDAPASHRAIVQFAVAAWAVFWLGGLDRLDLGVAVLPMPGIGSALAVVGIVWAMNLYNFMDGIDGIAAVEAISIALFSALLLELAGHRGLALIALVTAGSACGFLIWNREPARIFMGDVGSASLGYTFAVMALFADRAAAIPLLASGALAAVFVLDATITVVRRALRGERWYAAHRSHAYQRAVQAGASHTRVVTAVALLNALLGLSALVAWLRPALLLPATGTGFALVLVAYLLVERRRPMFPPRDGFARSAGAEASDEATIGH
jgi:Fuc2NAc and GlcNAc transferase